jgi:pyruvate ferredoxin oxidoreductase delta subunit
MSQQQKGWKEIPVAGVCWKSSTEYPTGDWRTFKPVRDPEKCTKCLLCPMICPDAAIKWIKATEEIVFDYEFCKGCGICANECPAQAIKMVREGES